MSTPSLVGNALPHEEQFGEHIVRVRCWARSSKPRL
jgi:hypothetical protein